MDMHSQTGNFALQMFTFFELLLAKFLSSFSLLGVFLCNSLFVGLNFFLSGDLREALRACDVLNGRLRNQCCTYYSFGQLDMRELRVADARVHCAFS